MTKIHPKSESKMAELYKSGKSMKEIAEAFHVSTGTVHTHLKKYVPAAERRKRQFPKLLNERMLSQIKRQYESGLSSVAIGRKLDLAPETILYHLEKMNVVRTEKYKPKIDAQKLEEIKKSYGETGSILKTAGEFGLHPSSVHYRLVKLGLVKKNRINQKIAREKYEMLTDVLTKLFEKMGYEMRYVQKTYNGHGPDMIVENGKESVLIEHKATVKRSWYWQHAIEEVNKNVPKYNVARGIVITTARKPAGFKEGKIKIIFFDDLQKLLEENELLDLIPKIEHISNTPSA